MLREYRREVAGKGEIGAYEDSVSDGNGEPEQFGIRVADAERKPGALHALVDFHTTKHVHAVLRDRVLLGGDADLAESQSFAERFHDFVVRDGSVGRRA